MSRVLHLVQVSVVAGIALFTVAQILAVGAGAFLPDLPPTNPFAEFARLIPGAPIDSISDIECEYRYNYPSIESSLSYCMHLPDHDLIEWISINGRDGVIQRVTFGVRLRYGDMVALFGQAKEQRHYPVIASFEWDGIYASGTVRRAARISMLTRISRVTFRLEDGA